MPATIKQEPRLLAIETPLGEDVLTLQAFSGQEQLSRLFSFQMDLVSAKEDIEPKDIVGEKVTWSLIDGDGKKRNFNGHIRKFAGGATGLRKERRYSAEVVPWLWFLTRTSDCRIFQNDSAPEILEAVFENFGFNDFRMELTETHPKRDYCVQYRETAFSFVSRLMEDEGMFYRFEHEHGKHTLVVADHKGAYVTRAESQLEYVSGTPEKAHIHAWEHEYQFRTGKYAQQDYNFESPDTDLHTRTNTLVQLDNVDVFEHYDYPGEYRTKAHGQRSTERRMEEQEVVHDVVQAASNYRTLHPAGTFKLSRHDVATEEGRSYAITSVNHMASDFSQYASGEAPTYENTFTCIPSSVMFRPARQTPKPFVQGPQTAFVVGPKGEEIYPDRYGRVKVQFHWDRRGEYDENSSCWVRVAQTAAGKEWGAMTIPRVGHEVIVDFLEGDPDRPIVTGRVYNGANMPPYPLPDNKTLSTMKSNSSNGGGGFNEIRFEDKRGEEQIFIHAQRNADIRIKADCYELIGAARHLIVEKDQLEHIKNNRNEQVDADHIEAIGKDRHLAIKGKEAKAVDKSLSLTVKGDVSEAFKSNHSEQVSGDYYLKASNVVIEAAANITLKVGGSHIAIDASGIKLGTSGTIKIEAGGIVQAQGSLIKLN